MALPASYWQPFLAIQPPFQLNPAHPSLANLVPRADASPAALASRLAEHQVAALPSAIQGVARKQQARFPGKVYSEIVAQLREAEPDEPALGQPERHKLVGCILALWLLSPGMLRYELSFTARLIHHLRGLALHLGQAADEVFSTKLATPYTIGHWADYAADPAFAELFRRNWQNKHTLLQALSPAMQLKLYYEERPRPIPEQPLFLAAAAAHPYELAAGLAGLLTPHWAFVIQPAGVSPGNEQGFPHVDKLCARKVVHNCFSVLTPLLVPPNDHLTY
jgi:hypothetical protein